MFSKAGLSYRSLEKSDEPILKSFNDQFIITSSYTHWVIFDAQEAVGLVSISHSLQGDNVDFTQIKVPDRRFDIDGHVYSLKELLDAIVAEFYPDSGSHEDIDY